jgi:hypothetical protein
MRVSLLGCVAAAACGSDSKPASAPADRNDSVRPVLRAVHEAPGPAGSLYETPGHGRTVQVFVSHDREPKPVVFLLRGSVCAPAFTAEADDRFDQANLFQDVLPRESSRVHFAIVEKPGVATLRGQWDDDRELHGPMSEVPRQAQPSNCDDGTKVCGVATRTNGEQPAS